VAALLAYLAIHPGNHSREKLLELFWPDLDIDAGRHALSVALSHLRDLLEKGLDQLPGTLIRANRDSVGLRPGSYTTDLASVTDPERLLPGFYDDWVLEVRERLSQKAPQFTTTATQIEPLPAALTPYIGGERRKEEARALLAGTRLLTLVGPGGVGKTRLALETLHAQTRTVAWVELASLNEPAGITARITAALGLKQPSELLPVLRQTPLVLGLDNGEHLIEAVAAEVTRLLRACPSLTLLVTCREPLNVPGETLLRLTGLPEDEAVALFCECAQRVQPNWSPSAEEEPVLRQLCQKLDGLPLALELAAAKLRVLPLQALVQKLGSRLSTLTSGNRTAEPRQKTLRDTIAWSYDLLNDAEQAFFAQLAVFHGGWTAHSAGELHEDPESSQELLDSLVDKSLIQVEGTSHGIRYHFLETIREFALEQLNALPTETQVSLHRRHQEVFFTLTQTDEAWHYDLTLKMARRLNPEQENLKQALAFCERDNPERFVEFCISVVPYWLAHLRNQEAHQLLTTALTLPIAQAPTASRQQLLRLLAWVCLCQQDWEGVHRATDLRTETQKALGIPTQEYETDAFLAMNEGKLDEAARLYGLALDQVRSTGNQGTIASVLGNFSQLHLLRGELREARSAIEERQRLQDGGHWTTLNLALVDLLEGNVAAARGGLLPVIAYHKEHAAHGDLGYNWVHLGMLMLRQGELSRAAQFYGVSYSWSEHFGAVVFQPERGFRDRDLAQLRLLLDPETFQNAFNQGYAWTPEEALAQLDF